MSYVSTTNDIPLPGADRKETSNGSHRFGKVYPFAGDTGDSFAADMKTALLGRETYPQKIRTDLGVSEGDEDRVMRGLYRLRACTSRSQVLECLQKYRNDMKKLFVSREKLLALRASTVEGSTLDQRLQVLDDLMYSHTPNDPLSDAPKPNSWGVGKTELDNSQLAFILGNVARATSELAHTISESKGPFRPVKRKMKELAESMPCSWEDHTEGAVSREELVKCIIDYSRFSKNLLRVLSGEETLYE